LGELFEEEFFPVLWRQKLSMRNSNGMCEFCRVYNKNRPTLKKYFKKGNFPTTMAAVAPAAFTGRCSVFIGGQQCCCGADGRGICPDPRARDAYTAAAAAAGDAVRFSGTLKYIY